MPPIPVPHVSLPIFNPAASQSDNPRWKPPVSSFHGNRRCRSWSSPIVEVVLVTSSPNKKVPRVAPWTCPCSTTAATLRRGRGRAPLRRLQETTDGARPHHFQHLQRLRSIQGHLPTRPVDSPLCLGPYIILSGTYKLF